MDFYLTIVEPLYLRRIENFTAEILTSINEKNVFAKFFPKGTLSKIVIPQDQKTFVNITKLTFEERRLRNGFPLHIFDTVTLQFEVKLQAATDGHELVLLMKSHPDFPPQDIVHGLDITMIARISHVFAKITGAQTNDMTPLKTYIGSKHFELMLPMPLNGIALTTHNRIYTLKYRNLGEAGFTPSQVPHLDDAEAQLLNAIATHRHRETLRQDSPPLTSRRPVIRRTSRHHSNHRSPPPRYEDSVTMAQHVSHTPRSHVPLPTLLPALGPMDLPQVTEASTARPITTSDPTIAGQV